MGFLTSTFVYTEITVKYHHGLSVSLTVSIPLFPHQNIPLHFLHTSLSGDKLG